MLAKRAFVRCEGIESEFHHCERRGREVNFAALNQRADADDFAAFAFDGLLNFTDGQAGGDDIFANENTLAGLNRKPAPPFHATIHTLREGDARSEVFADFVCDEDTAGERADDEIGISRAKVIGDNTAKLFSQSGLFEQTEFFHIDVAVPSAGKQKMSFEKGAAAAK